METLFSSLQQGYVPLAARLRPKTLDDFFGQEHIVGKGRLLRRSIEADQLSSVLFYGPPGTGKTTLARIIANTTKAYFMSLNAVLAGVAELRKSIEVAKQKKEVFAQRTILFIDEVHRWNKAQQDALLPWVENGTIIFIGATTENPYFEVIKPLVSRSRIFQLKSLTKEDLVQVVQRALQDKENGLGEYQVEITPDALEHLISMSNGDARSLLNALELAVITTPPQNNGHVLVDLAVAEESIQKKAVLYDKEGDVHYDTISAFIKSLRGSDPDAALYWLARMVYAGESPRFLFRRMLISAAEDVGLADPNAIRVVESCANAFEYVGMPEGRFHLAEAALYLATAPKSNSSMAFFDALKTVEKEAEAEVPNHLKDSSRDSESFGHGDGYMYPHEYRNHWVAQQYLPDFLQGRSFYHPSDQGYERNIANEVARKHEEQLAAMLEQNLPGHEEILTYSGRQVQAERDRWLSRTISQVGKSIGKQRDTILDHAKLQRHSLVLDLHATSGLLSWEILRRTPEGGTFLWEEDTHLAHGLIQQFHNMPQTEQPIVYSGSWSNCLTELLKNGIKLNAIVGRNALLSQQEIIQDLPKILATNGIISISEAIPNKTQRLYKLIDSKKIPFYEKYKEAEESIYQDVSNPSLQYNENDIEQALYNASFSYVEKQVQEQITDLHITNTLLNQWFSKSNNSQRTYRNYLEKFLSSEELAYLTDLFSKELNNHVVSWHYTICYYTAHC